jgi:hypothetical protein
MFIAENLYYWCYTRSVIPCCGILWALKMFVCLFLYTFIVLFIFVINEEEEIYAFTDH